MPILRVQTALHTYEGTAFAEPDSENEVIGEYFGLERKDKSCFMVDFRLKSGKSISYTYHYVQKMMFDATNGIAIYFSDSVVKIKGRNLTLLYTNLLRHRVVYVQEHLASVDKVSDSEIFVSEISIEDDLIGYEI